MAGSRKEWLRDQIPRTNPPFFPIRGGSWSDAQPIAFHLASQLEANVEHTGGRIGLRLVIRPRS